MSTLGAEVPAILECVWICSLPSQKNVMSPPAIAVRIVVKVTPHSVVSQSTNNFTVHLMSRRNLPVNIVTKCTSPWELSRCTFEPTHFPVSALCVEKLSPAPGCCRDTFALTQGRSPSSVPTVEEHLLTAPTSVLTYRHTQISRNTAAKLVLKLSQECHS